MIELVKPGLEDLDFRQSLLADRETMSYNDAWGGTIPFPREAWEPWHRAWLEAPEYKRYYRYLYDTAIQTFTGEAAYHYDARRRIHICSVIVLNKYRNRGYGTAAIRLLCEAAKSNGVSALYDDIAADNPSFHLFLKCGFTIDYQDDRVVMVKKNLQGVSNMNAFDMPFSKVYSCLVQKAGRKGRTRDEVDAIAAWLTGYTVGQIREMEADAASYGAFIDRAPAWNPRAELITGKVCGVQVETIADPRMKKLRQLDKLVDELAKGRPMEKILR